VIYLDNAATSFPKPETVYTAMDRFARESGANPGRGGHHMAVAAESAIASVRRALAEFFGGRDPHRLVFAFNATDALNMAIKGVLRRGDHVVTTDIEHNSVSRPLARLERDGFITVTRVAVSSDAVLDPDDIAKALRDRTRLVAVGHASNVLGTAQPIRAIGGVARRHGALMLVDAAQSAGLLAIDVERDQIDLLAFSGHKGLLGPMGTGGLYVGQRAAPAAWREGGTGGDSANPVQPAEFPNCLEAGTPNAAGIVGLGEGLRYILQRGLADLICHEIDLAARLWDRLAADDRFILHGRRPVSDGGRTAVVSLVVAEHPSEQVAAILDASFGIAVRAGLHCAPGAHRLIGTFPDGSLRVSPGPFSTTADVDALADALGAIVS